MQIKFKFIEALSNLALQNIAIANGDTLLAALGKLQGQINEQVNLTGTQSITGAKTFTANTTFSGDIAVNGGDITTTATTFNVASTATTLQIGAGTGTLRLGSFVGIGTSGNANNILNLSGTFTGDTARQGINQSVTINSEPLTAGRAYRGQSGIISNLVTTADKGTQTIDLQGVLFTAQNGTIDATQDVSATSVAGARFIGTERSASTVAIPIVTGVQGNTSHRGSATTTNSYGGRMFVVTESIFTGTVNNAHGLYTEVVNNAGTVDIAYGVRNVFSGTNLTAKNVGFFNDLNGGQTTVLDFATEVGQALKIGHWNSASGTAQVDLTFTANGAATFTQSVTAPVVIGSNVQTDDLQFVGTNLPVHVHAGGVSQLALANNTLYRIGTLTPQADAQHSVIQGVIHLSAGGAVRSFKFQAHCRRNTSASQLVNADLLVETDELDDLSSLGEFRLYLENTLPSSKFVFCFQTGSNGNIVLSTSWHVTIHDRSTKSLWEQVSTNTIFDPTGYTLLAPNMDNRTSSQKLTAPEFIGPLTGNASTASALQTPRTITLAGDVTGSTTFDGSANVTITAISNASSGAPTLVEANKSYKVAKNLQVLFTEEIDLEDGAEIDCDENAVLVEVN